MSTVIARTPEQLAGASAETCTHLELIGLELDPVPARLGEFKQLTLLRFDNCTLGRLDDAALRAGESAGKLDVELAYCNVDADALFERAVVQGLGNWRVSDYGRNYQRDPRWKTLASIGDDGLGDEAFRRAALAFAGKGEVKGPASEVHLRLLDHGKKPIREKVSLFLEGALENPLTTGKVPAGAKVWVLGAPVSHDKESLKARLEALGLGVAKGAKDAGAVLLLPKPGPKLEDALRAKLPVLVEGHLKASAAAVEPAPAAATATEAESLDALLFGGDAKGQRLGLSLAKARALEGALLADVVAVAFFAEAAEVRKEGRALLLAHAPDALRARLTGDKRNYFSIDDGAKLTKLAKELATVGVPADSFTRAMLRLFAARPHPYGGTTEPALAAALAHNPGREPEVFELLAAHEEIYLDVKKTFPKGLSRLRALRKLRILHSIVTSSTNVAELAELPQPVTIEYWVKDTKLEHLLPAASNISALYFRGSFSNLSDISALARFPKLVGLGLEETSVSDLSPLAGLSLTHLDVGRSEVTSLEPLRGMTSLVSLGVKQLGADLSPIATLTELERLDVSFTAITDLSLLAPLTKLRSLDLWGCKVTDLSPLAGKPLQTLTLSYSGVTPRLAPLAQCPELSSLSLIGVEVDEAELEALKAKLPDLYVSR